MDGALAPRNLATAASGGPSCLRLSPRNTGVVPGQRAIFQGYGEAPPAGFEPAHTAPEAEQIRGSDLH
jgi:hypothetical protein